MIEFIVFFQFFLVLIHHYYFDIHKVNTSPKKNEREHSSF